MCINVCKQSRSLAQMKLPGRGSGISRLASGRPPVRGRMGVCQSECRRANGPALTTGGSCPSISVSEFFSSLPAPPHPSRGLCGASAPLLPRVGQTEPPTSHPQRQKPSCMFSAPPFPQEAGGELLFFRLSQHRIQARSCD